LRATLGAQGWYPGQKVTAISDGEVFLPNPVRAATKVPVRHILDWFHLSHRRYHSDRPISTSRAEGCVDEIANARMGGRQRMRWSPRGTHRVAVVRNAVLDGRLEAISRNQTAA